MGLRMTVKKTLKEESHRRKEEERVAEGERRETGRKWEKQQVGDGIARL